MAENPEEGAVFLLHKSPFELKAANAEERKELEPPSVPIPKDFLPTPESAHAVYQMDMGAFRGPLDLLLFLIRRHEIDIFDIPIAFICEHYLEAVQAMEDMSLDVASEFMYLAAELLYIKSRLLLPQPEKEEEEEEGDPRAELVQRLLEYQKYQAAAAELAQLDRLGRDVFAHPPEPLPVMVGLPALREVSIFSLVHAFNGVLKRQAPEVRHKVVVEQVSVRKRMQNLVDALGAGENILFYSLMSAARERIDVVLCFLAVLELTRMKLLRLLECEDGQLYLQPRYTDVAEAMQRLDGEASVIDAQFV